MRRDVLDLRDFYATPLGQAAQAMIARKVGEAWGPASGLDLMGLGYAAPYLGAFTGQARRADRGHTGGPGWRPGRGRAQSRRSER